MRVALDFAAAVWKHQVVRSPQGGEQMLRDGSWRSLTRGLTFNLGFGSGFLEAFDQHLQLRSTRRCIDDFRLLSATKKACSKLHVTQRGRKTDTGQVPPEHGSKDRKSVGKGKSVTNLV